ncbi:hypothetical protein GCM10009678_23850 [Actinomadura kijaniata]|uniref:Uncharacterized protein n=1 Tax=Actinomadura namibiensis TaxID=182080 RepID=A0A7W3QM61_ACTNM|nr:hypothetical protein [Actinomadura namibiensis]MBA8951673.1 hypothetical protein [Actinomadura namibiensis]
MKTLRALPADPEEAGRGERRGGPAEPGEPAGRVDGRGADDLARLLRAARPDPLVLRYAGLDPDRRLARVREAMAEGG